MKVYRNLTQIKKRETRGRRFSLVGLGILFVGLLASFVPTWINPLDPVQPGPMGFLQQYWSWISFAALFIGFICASIGSYFINRYARRRWPGSRFYERPDEVLERFLVALLDTAGELLLLLLGEQRVRADFSEVTAQYRAIRVTRFHRTPLGHGIVDGRAARIQ